MHYIYILQSISFPDQIYIGCTNNVESRLIVHNRGESPHPAKFKPWKIAAYIALDNANQAYDFEEYLKSHSGRTFLRKRLLANSALTII